MLAESKVCGANSPSKGGRLQDEAQAPGRLGGSPCSLHDLPLPSPARSPPPATAGGPRPLHAASPLCLDARLSSSLDASGQLICLAGQRSGSRSLPGPWPACGLLPTDSQPSKPVTVADQAVYLALGTL